MHGYHNDDTMMDDIHHQHSKTRKKPTSHYFKNKFSLHNKIIKILNITFNLS